MKGSFNPDSLTNKIIRRMAEAREESGFWITNADIAAEVGLPLKCVDARISRMGLGRKTTQRRQGKS